MIGHRRLFAVTATVVCCLSSTFATPSARAATSLPALLIWPAQVHTGDTVYVSGTDLPSHTQITFLVACPSWASTSMAGNHNWEAFQGGKTDSQGNLLGVQLRAIVLHGVSASTCAVYARTMNSPFLQQEQVPYFTILPPDQQLPSCAQHICLLVSSGHVEQASFITIYGWGGARGTATITYNKRKKISRQQSFQLDWSGTANIPVNPALLAKSKKVRVVVSAQLGKATGAYTGTVVLR